MSSFCVFLLSFLSLFLFHSSLSTNCSSSLGSILGNLPFFNYIHLLGGLMHFGVFCHSPAAFSCLVSWERWGWLYELCLSTSLISCHPGEFGQREAPAGDWRKGGGIGVCLLPIFSLLQTEVLVMTVSFCAFPKASHTHRSICIHFLGPP